MIYTRLVNRIVVAIIEWLTTLKSVDNKSHFETRRTVLDFLTCYFNTLALNNNLNMKMDIVVQFILKNIKMADTGLKVGLTTF